MMTTLQTNAFHHIGIACRDLDHGMHLFGAFGYSPERPDVVDELQGVRARFMTGSGPRIELLCDLEGRTVLSNVLKSGDAFHHLAYEVDDLDRAARDLAELGAKEVAGPTPAIAFDMRPIAFWMLPTMLLIEIISRS
jgi:methylmalonyl-CoA/ethylmalonyl-CoA epimerase